MKQMKRLMALLMVLAMLVTNLPLAALAMDTTPEAEPAQTAQETVEETTAVQSQEETAEETVAQTVEETVAETVEETVAETVEETVEETVAETVEETVAETVEETIAEVVAEAAAEETAVQEPALTAAQNEPYLTWRTLSRNQEGWYEDGMNSAYEAHGIMAYGNQWCIFYLNLWNEHTQSFSAYPVKVTTSSRYLNIVPLSEMDNGNQQIASGQGNSPYFAYVEGVNTIEGETVTVSCTYGGKSYSFDFEVMPRFMGYYSTPYASLESVVRGQAYLTPGEDTYELYFVNLDPAKYEYISVEIQTDDFGRDYSNQLFGGAPLVTKSAMDSNGVITLTVNPDYVKFARESKGREQFRLTVFIEWKDVASGEINRGNQQLTIQPEGYNNYYLSVAWLNNWGGKGWFFDEYNMDQGGNGSRYGMDTMATDYVMFFLNEKNADGTWTRTPVTATVNSPYVTAEKLLDIENEMGPRPGEQYADYFLRLSSHGTLEEEKFYLDVEHNGETLRFASYLHIRPLHFYTENRISVDTAVNQYVNINMNGEPGTLYLLKDPDHTIDNLQVYAQDHGGEYLQFTDGEPLVDVTEITGGWTVKVNPKFIQKAIAYRNSYWMNLRIEARYDTVDDNGNYRTHYTGIDLLPPLDKGSLLLAYNLEYYNGWYNPQNAPIEHMGMGTPSQRYLVFYLVPWNASTQSYGTPVPVKPISNDPELKVLSLKDQKDEDIRQGAVDSDYYCLLRSETLDFMAAELSVTYYGETITAPMMLYEFEMNFYTAPTISLETVVFDGQYTMDPSTGEDNVVYLLTKDSNRHKLENMTWYVDTWGERPYTELARNSVTMEETSDGYKFIIDREYVQQAAENRAYDDWMDFNIVVTGQMHDLIDDYFYDDYYETQVNIQPPAPSDNAPYISAHWLWNDGDGWYVPDEPTGKYMGTMSLDWSWMIFYLNTWNGQRWESVPVIPETDSEYLKITKVKDLNENEFDNRVLAGQTLSDYFVHIRSFGTLGGFAERITATHNGTTVGAPFRIYSRDVSFYTENTVSLETLIADYNYRIGRTESEEAIYLKTYNSYGCTVGNLEVTVEAWDDEQEDWGNAEEIFSDILGGEPLVTMEEISEGHTYKLIFNQKYVDYVREHFMDDYRSFCLSVSGNWYDEYGQLMTDFDENGNEVPSEFQQVCWIEPTRDPYICAWELHNDGKGWYADDDSEPVFDYGTRGMDWNWYLFFLFTWDEHEGRYMPTPVVPTVETENLTVTKIMDLPENIGVEGVIREDYLPRADYMVQIRSHNTLGSDDMTETLYFEVDGKTYEEPFRIHNRSLSFYDSDVISVDTCMPDRQFVIDPKATGEEVIYFRTYNRGDRTIGDVEFEVISHGYDYHEFTYGADAVRMEELEDGTGYKFIVNQDFVDYVRKHYKINRINLQLRVRGNWYNENGEFIHAFEDECWINSPDDTDPFICAWRLDNQGDGWFVVEDEPPTVDYGTRGMDCNWFVFFLFTWDETKGRYVPEPIIPYENSNNLEVNRLVDMTDGEFGDVTIRDDQIRGDYMVQVLSRNSLGGADETEMMYYKDAEGNVYDLPVRIHARETGFYTTSTRSIETSIYNGQFQLDGKAEENAVYYMIETPYEHTFENVSFTTNTGDQDYSEMFCDGEDLISWEAISGGYKITINPKYVEAMSTCSDWHNFAIRAEWDRVSPDGRVDHEDWEQIWINPPERYDPFLSYGFLDEQGEGWYLDQENIVGDHYWRFQMTGMNDRWMVFFLNTYNENTKQWTRTPFVPTITGDGIKMYTMEQTGDRIAEGAEYAEYYRHLKSRGSLYSSTFTIGCDNVPGYEDLTFAGYIIDRQVAFYTTEEPSVHTIKHLGDVTLDPNGENVFYVSKLHADAELRDFTWGINSWGENYSRYCDGEPVVTMTETDLGYKFTVNPKFVEYATKNANTNFKNFCLYFSTNVYALDGEIDVVWEDYLWINPPAVSVDLDNIVNSNQKIEDKVVQVQNMDTDTLKSAMENDEQVVDQLKQLEEKAMEKSGTEVKVDATGSEDIKRGEIIGAGLNNKEEGRENEDITLVIDKPSEEKPKEEIDEKYNSDVNIQFSMTLDNVANTEELEVPVMITLPVPKEVKNVNLLVLLHYHGDNEAEQVKFTISVDDAGNYFITFALDGFSDFVMTQQKLGDVNRDGSIDDSDAIYVIWHTMFPQMYPLSVSAVDMDSDEKVTAADALELLWNALF